MKKLVAFLALAGASAGCHADYNLVLLPTTKEAPRDPCEFDVVVKFPPASGNEEIGRLEVDFWPSHDLGAFKEAVKGEVCRVGADTVVAEMQDGRINDAILYRSKPGLIPPPDPVHIPAP